MILSIHHLGLGRTISRKWTMRNLHIYPYALTSFIRMAENETTMAWERDTWKILADLAENVPEAGIHFQSGHDFFTE